MLHHVQVFNYIKCSRWRVHVHSATHAHVHIHRAHALTCSVAIINRACTAVSTKSRFLYTAVRLANATRLNKGGAAFSLAQLLILPLPSCHVCCTFLLLLIRQRWCSRRKSRTHRRRDSCRDHDQQLLNCCSLPWSRPLCRWNASDMHIPSSSSSSSPLLLPWLLLLGQFEAANSAVSVVHRVHLVGGMRMDHFGVAQRILPPHAYSVAVRNAHKRL